MPATCDQNTAVLAVFGIVIIALWTASVFLPHYKWSYTDNVDGETVTLQLTDYILKKCFGATTSNPESDIDMCFDYPNSGSQAWCAQQDTHYTMRIVGGSVSAGFSFLAAVCSGVRPEYRNRILHGSLFLLSLGGCGLAIAMSVLISQLNACPEFEQDLINNFPSLNRNFDSGFFVMCIATMLSLVSCIGSCCMKSTEEIEQGGGSTGAGATTTTRVIIAGHNNNTLNNDYDVSSDYQQYNNYNNGNARGRMANRQSVGYASESEISLPTQDNNMES